MNFLIYQKMIFLILHFFFYLTNGQYLDLNCPYLNKSIDYELNCTLRVSSIDNLTNTEVNYGDTQLYEKRIFK